MIANLLKKIFGSRNERLLKQFRKSVLLINSLEADLKKLSDDELKAKTEIYKDRVKNGTPLDEILPEAFAVVS